MTSIYGIKSEDVPQESAVCHRIFAVKDHMRTKDHKLCPFHANYSLHRERSASERESRNDLVTSNAVAFSHRKIICFESRNHTECSYRLQCHQHQASLSHALDLGPTEPKQHRVILALTAR